MLLSKVIDIYTHSFYSQITGNTTWASAALESMKAECMEEALSDSALISTDNGHALITDIKEAMCVNECNGNGKCVKGEYCNKIFSTPRDC